MTRIERIQPSLHKKDRVLVYLTGGDLLRITPEELLRFGLRPGQELTEDVLEELRLPAAAPAPAGDAPDATTPAQQEVLQALGFDPLGLDALVARTGLDAATLQVRLLELELDGRVARLPGGLFQRLGAA